MVVQLKLSLPRDRTDVIEAVYAAARDRGWIDEPRGTGQGRKRRWHYPQSTWYLRADLYATQLYTVEHGAKVRSMSIPTRQLSKVTLALDRIALEVQASLQKREQ